MDWVRIRPILDVWPGGAPPPTFVITADENGDMIIELAWDPQALLAPASYSTEPLRYYSSDNAFSASITNDDGTTRNISVPVQTIRLARNRAAWTIPQALWDGYVQESLKSLNSPPTSTFSGNLYYRVRGKPSGSSTGRVWPSDTVIRNNSGAPHLSMLAMSAAPLSQVVPDKKAVNAMGGIIGFPKLWGDILLWLWKNLPESNSDRRVLVKIFGHKVFKTEITDVNIRGKILKLWLFAGPKARPELTNLLDRRVVTGSNITQPVVTQCDLKGTNTLADNLLSMLFINPHPDIVGSPSGTQLLGDVLFEILDPNGQINQGNAGTCSPTAIQTMLIDVNPAEYVRLQLGLLSSSGSVVLANGTSVTLPPGIFQVARYSGAQTDPFYIRNNSELAFQATILKYAQGARFPAYNPKSLPKSKTGIHTVFQWTIKEGLLFNEIDRALEGIFKVNFATHVVPTNTDAAISGAQPGIRDGFFRDLPAAQQPLALALWWGAPYTNHAKRGGHMVLALRRESGRIFFKNPQYAGSKPPGGAVKGSATNNPPRRYEDPSATLESITDADFATWLMGYWVPDHAI